MTPALLSAAVLNAVLPIPGSELGAGGRGSGARRHQCAAFACRHLPERHLRADCRELRDRRGHVVDRSAGSAPTSSPCVASTRVLELRRTPARRRAPSVSQQMIDQETNHGELK